MCCRPSGLSSDTANGCCRSGGLTSCHIYIYCCSGIKPLLRSLHSPLPCSVVCYSPTILVDTTLATRIHFASLTLPSTKHVCGNSVSCLDRHSQPEHSRTPLWIFAFCCATRYLDTLLCSASLCKTLPLDFRARFTLRVRL